MITVSALLLILIIPLTARRRGLVPKGFYNVIETICVFLREDVARPFLKDRTDRYIGFLWTLFFFILTMNLLGLVPLSQMIWLVTSEPNHIGGVPTGNLYVTGALATFAFFLFHIAGIVEKGFVRYFATLAPKVPWPLVPFMFVMELLSSFVRVFSLAIRLFANMIAGTFCLQSAEFHYHVQEFTCGDDGYYHSSRAMRPAGNFRGVLQAYIFVFLTTIFIDLRYRRTLEIQVKNY